MERTYERWQVYIVCDSCGDALVVSKSVTVSGGYRVALVATCNKCGITYNDDPEEDEVE